MTKFNLEDILNEHYIKGVIHIGGYIGEEFGSYKSHNIKNIMFFEPQKMMYDIMINNISNLIDDEYVQVFNVALGNFNGATDMFIAHNPTDPLLRIPGTASSSILPPKKHLTEHTMVTFPTKEKIHVRKLDDIIKEYKIDLNNFSFANIDVQGYELEVLKGSINTLNSIDYILAEVNNDELYEQCALIGDIDSFLQPLGFVREKTNWICKMWGEAFYRKNKQ